MKRSNDRFPVRAQFTLCLQLDSQKSIDKLLKIWYNMYVIKREEKSKMQVNVTKTNKPKRIVGSMKPNEAFKIGGYWYIPISMDDESIGRDYQTFWETHAETIPGYHEPYKMESAIACFRVPSSSFVYLDPDLEVEDYGVPSLSVTLS